jgi:hypothetical protein
MNCVNSYCAGNAGCPPNQGRCGLDCINHDNDNRHCGMCDIKVGCDATWLTPVRYR